jgi:hypothetical protein
MIPKGTPIIIETKAEIKTRTIVSKNAGHKPKLKIKYKPKAEPTANFRPEAKYARKAVIPIISHQGTKANVA